MTTNTSEPMWHRSVGGQASKIGLREGDVVRTRRSVERGSFIVPKGELGTIVTLESDLLEVRIDEQIPGAEPWDNEVVWTVEDVETIAGDIEFVSRRSETT